MCQSQASQRRAPVEAQPDQLENGAMDCHPQLEQPRNFQESNENLQLKKKLHQILLVVSATWTSDSTHASS